MNLTFKTQLHVLDFVNEKFEDWGINFQDGQYIIDRDGETEYYNETEMNEYLIEWWNDTKQSLSLSDEEVQEVEEQYFEIIV